MLNKKKWLRDFISSLLTFFLGLFGIISLAIWPTRDFAISAAWLLVTTVVAAYGFHEMFELAKAWKEEGLDE